MSKRIALVAVLTALATLSFGAGPAAAVETPPAKGGGGEIIHAARYYANDTQSQAAYPTSVKVESRLDDSVESGVTLGVTANVHTTKGGPSRTSMLVVIRDCDGNVSRYWPRGVETDVSGFYSLQGGVSSLLVMVHHHTTGKNGQRLLYVAHTGTIGVDTDNSQIGCGEDLALRGV